MGGRAAEQLVYGEVTTGASADIKQATAMARRMVTEWGMSDAMGPQFYGTRDEVLFLGREVNRSHDLSDDTARQIDAEVKRILDEAYARAEGILRERRKELDEITELLMEKETIEGRDVTDILTHGRVLSQKERDEEDAAKEAAAGGEASTPAEAKADGEAQEAEKETPEGTPESGGGE
jgi:cell division protease FtsH